MRCSRPAFAQTCLGICGQHRTGAVTSWGVRGVGHMVWARGGRTDEPRPNSPCAQRSSAPHLGLCAQPSPQSAFQTVRGIFMSTHNTPLPTSDFSTAGTCGDLYVRAFHRVWRWTLSCRLPARPRVCHVAPAAVCVPGTCGVRRVLGAPGPGPFAVFLTLVVPSAGRSD